MNKLLYLFLFLPIQLWSQNTISYNNEPCGSGILHQQLMQSDSRYAAILNQFEAARQLTTQRNTNSTLLIIPVVVHILYKGEAVGVGTNLSDQAVYNKIKAINDNYRKSIGTSAYGTGVDTEIEFALAVRTPSGGCTNGIERIDMSSNTVYMNYGVRFATTNGISPTEYKDVYAWNPLQYYNIYIVSEIDNNNAGNGYQGFAPFAPSHGTVGDGAVFLGTPYNVPIGSIESHEIGHGLNLYHTFEGDGSGNTCPTANGCGGALGDCCSDTPPHKRSATGCNSSGTNSCDGNSLNLLFFKNFMNYATCPNVFTQEQKDRMRAAILTIRSSYLRENGNTSLLPTASPIASYLSTVTNICAGDRIKFTDRSSCMPNIQSNASIAPTLSFNWVFTSGATTVTSTLQNPLLQFTTAGNYNLSYTVTNAFGSNTLVVSNAVTVTATTTLACIPTSNFQGQSGYSIFNMEFNTINNHTPQGYSEGYRDFSCSKMTDVNANGTYYLRLTASSFTLLGATLYVAAYIDYNNNGSFETGERIFQGQLVPGASNYLFSNPIVMPATSVANTYLRMRTIASTNPITDDYVNCTTPFAYGDVEDYAVKILNPLSNANHELATVVVFPNPAHDRLVIQGSQAIQKVQLYSMLGQLVFEAVYNDTMVSLEVDHYPKGIYFISVHTVDNNQLYKILKD